jgi:hypothetical protein
MFETEKKKKQKDFKHKFATNPRMGYLEEYGMASALQWHM